MSYCDHSLACVWREDGYCLIGTYSCRHRGQACFGLFNAYNMFSDKKNVNSFISSCEPKAQDELL